MSTRRAHSRKSTPTRRRLAKCSSKSTIVKTFMEMTNMVKIYHWNTRSYAEHKATDELHDRLSKNIDSFVEVLLGKDASRLTRLAKSTKLVNAPTTRSLREKMFAFRTFLTGMNKCFDSARDSDLLSIRDDILADVNQFLYLLTLS